MKANNFSANLLKKFNEAEKSLEMALRNLEEVIFVKLEEMDAKIINSKSNTQDLPDNDQDFEISSLSAEINNLQQSLAEVGLENESLLEKNKELNQKISDFKSQLPQIVADIEKDLAKISELFKHAQQDIDL